MQAPRDENFVPAMLFMGSDGETYPVEGSEITGRLFVDVPGGSGTVTSVSVVSANGLAGTVATATTTPAITLSTTITGILKGNGTAISAVTVGTGLAFDGTTLSSTITGNVTKVGTPVNNQIGVWTGDGTIEGDAALTFDTATDILTISGILIDGANNFIYTTNAVSPASLYLFAGEATSGDNSGAGVEVSSGGGSGTGNGGPVQFTAGLGGATGDGGFVTFIAGDGGATSGNGGDISFVAGDTQGGNSDGGDIIFVTGQKFGSGIDGKAKFGSGAGNATLESNGNFDLILQTGNATTGNITIADGANADITIDPDGSGDVVIATTGELRPSANDGTALGVAGTAWSDLFLASGGVINWDSGDVVITHSANALTFSGGSYLFSGTAGPSANDGSALGTSTVSWSDLFLAEGGVINWDNGDVTVTQTGNVLAVAGGDLRVATADVGTNADSVPTLSSTSTFTNKTLTSPTINTATIGGATTLNENASIDLDPSLSADGTYSGICITGTAGTTLAFGDLIYLAAADSRWELVDADSVTTCGAVLTGMCVLAAAADGNATKVLLKGNIRADAAFPTFTIGANVYAGLTAGDVVTTAPSATDDVVHVVGKALTADSMYFDPSEDYITIV